MEAKNQPPNNVEKRYFHGDFDVRAVEGDSQTIGEVRGYAAVFDSLSEILGIWTQFREKIAPGAFASSVKSNDVRAFWSHNPDFVLGRTGNQTLTLEEDSRGLRFSLKLPDTQLGRDALTLIRNRTVSGMSFGFTIREEEWKKGDKTNLPVRTLKDIDLFEISPVAFPAYPASNVDARSVFVPDAVEARLKELSAECAGPTRLNALKAGINKLFRSLPFDAF